MEHRKVHQRRSASSDISTAILWLKAAIERHQRHMDGSEATDEESQNIMMQEMKNAMSALVMDDGDDEMKKGYDNDLERRFITEKVEYRAVDGSEMGEVFGYALKWGVEYDMGDFTEVIARSALDKADISDVRVLDNHNSHLILGRTKSKTATVGMDDVGMWFRATLPNSPNGHNMRESLLRGDIDQSSWGFKIRRDENGRRTGDKWEVRNGKEYRTIHDVSIVYDASPVTFPANPDTSAAKRSRNEHMSEIVKAPELSENRAETWQLSGMMDNVAWATYRGNDMVSSMNSLVSTYEYYGKQDNDEAALFAALAEQCKACKMALITMIDGHIDALKALNGAENRSISTEEKEAEKLETETRQDEQINTNTNNPELLEMELELIEAEIRAKTLRYEICN